jgi:hypothetical protein
MWPEIGYFMARQIINNALFMMFFCASVVFARILYHQMRISGWYKESQNKAGIALLAISMGETIARGWTILYLNAVATKIDPFDIRLKYHFALVGTITVIIGVSCLLRIFTRSNKEWIATVLITTLFIFGMVLVPQP